MARRRPSPIVTGEPVVWIGGRVAGADGPLSGVPDAPDLIVWMELPSHDVLSMTVVHPRDEITFADTLADAMRSPGGDHPRRPALVRVPDAILAAELDAVFGGTPRVEVAPTPELAELLANLGDRDSHSGAVPSLRPAADYPAILPELMAAAHRLWERPWGKLDSALRVDSPAHDIRAGLLSFLDGPRGRYGLVFFPAVPDPAAVIAIETDEDGPLDLGPRSVGIELHLLEKVDALERAAGIALGWISESSEV